MNTTHILDAVLSMPGRTTAPFPADSAYRAPAGFTRSVLAVLGRLKLYSAPCIIGVECILNGETLIVGHGRVQG